jgi:hypothetical protein
MTPDFMMRKGVAGVCSLRARPLFFGYDVFNRAPFRVSLSGVLPSIARFCFAEIF